jgi:hypothetical protein
MATKTLTKPKRKQSSQTRSWENLTDRSKLRHIENTLDKAIPRSRCMLSLNQFRTLGQNKAIIFSRIKR